MNASFPSPVVDSGAAPLAARHIFRLNQAGVGYSLFAGDRHGMRQEIPEIPSPNIPEEYLWCQRNIDRFLDQAAGVWSASFRTIHSDGFALAYGCKIGVTDDRGRPGVTFLHCILDGDLSQLPACALALLNILSFQNVAELAKNIEGVAHGDAAAAELMQSLMNIYEERAHAYLSNVACTPQRPATLSPLQEILHDCAGAQAIAWLTFAVQQTRTKTPWGVFDCLSHKGQASTVLEPGGGRRALASEIYLKAAMALTTEDETTPAPHEMKMSNNLDPTEFVQPPSTLILAAGQKNRQKGWLVIALAIGIGILFGSSQQFLRLKADLKHSEEVLARIKQETQLGIESIRAEHAKATPLSLSPVWPWGQLSSGEQYTRVHLLEEAPPPNDCHSPDDAGRMAVSSGSDGVRLYICPRDASGWKTASDPPQKPRALKRPKKKMPASK